MLAIFKTSLLELTLDKRMTEVDVDISATNWMQIVGYPKAEFVVGF